MDDILKVINDIKRPALEFHHEDILGVLAKIERKIDNLQEDQDKQFDMLLNLKKELRRIDTSWMQYYISCSNELRNRIEHLENRLQEKDKKIIFLCKRQEELWSYIEDNKNGISDNKIEIGDLESTD